MLKPDDFPPEHLQTLTEQINNWLGDMIRTYQIRVPASPSAATADSFELGEQSRYAYESAGASGAPPETK